MLGVVIGLCRCGPPGSVPSGTLTAEYRFCACPSRSQESQAKCRGDPRIGPAPQPHLQGSFQLQWTKTKQAVGKSLAPLHKGHGSTSGQLFAPIQLSSRAEWLAGLALAEHVSAMGWGLSALPALGHSKWAAPGASGHRLSLQPSGGTRFLTRRGSCCH